MGADGPELDEEGGEDGGEGGEEDMEVDESAPNAPPVCVPDTPRDDIQEWNDSCLREDVVEKRERDDGAEWRAALKLTPERVSRAALAKAPSLGAEGTLAKLTSLATTFFRSSALAMQYSLLLQGDAGEEDAQSFLTLGTVDFLQQADGVMREKYDATRPGESGGGGEYVPQDGFGWTNGVALWLLDRYGDAFARALREDAAAGPESQVG